MKKCSRTEGLDGVDWFNMGTNMNAQLSQECQIGMWLWWFVTSTRVQHHEQAGGGGVEGALRWQPQHPSHVCQRLHPHVQQGLWARSVNLALTFPSEWQQGLSASLSLLHRPLIILVPILTDWWQLLTEVWQRGRSASLLSPSHWWYWCLCWLIGDSYWLRCDNKVSQPLCLYFTVHWEYWCLCWLVNDSYWLRCDNKVGQPLSLYSPFHWWYWCLCWLTGDSYWLRCDNKVSQPLYSPPSIDDICAYVDWLVTAIDWGVTAVDWWVTARSNNLSLSLLPHPLMILVPVLTDWWHLLTDDWQLLTDEWQVLSDECWMTAVDWWVLSDEWQVMIDERRLLWWYWCHCLTNEGWIGWLFQSPVWWTLAHRLVPHWMRSTMLWTPWPPYSAAKSHQVAGNACTHSICTLFLILTSFCSLGPLSLSSRFQNMIVIKNTPPPP